MPNKEFEKDSSWSFSPSAQTTAADKTRQDLQNQKPGEFTYQDYQKSDAVQQAEATLQQHLANKPGAYQSQWQAGLDDIMNKIMNREDFSYDLNGDALYQQYKDKYIQQGKMAMQDTMGQAQAMTGGYGNSYAQSVGQQAYQSSLQNLNDIVPELYQLALDKYNQEGQELYNQYGLYADRDNQDYGRHRDTVSDFYTDLSYLTDDARYKAEDDYGKWSDKTSMDYGIHRDSVSDYYTNLGIANEEYWNLYNRDYGQYTDKQSFDLALEQWNWEKDQASKVSYGNGGGNTGDGGNGFQKATFARVDENGNYVFYIDGKERTYAPGVNPYTGTTNGDVENGTFSNGYQPDNINGQKLTKSGITDVVNGVTQNVWKTPDGKLWIWDGTKNEYLEYGDGSAPSKNGTYYGGGGGGGDGRKTVKLLN